MTDRPVITPVITNPEFYNERPQGDDPPAKRHDGIPSSVEATTDEMVVPFAEIDRIMATERYRQIQEALDELRLRRAQR